MREPDLRLDVYLVEYGMQVDVIVDGETRAEVCRDFGGDHDVQDMLNDLYRRIVDTIEKFRSDM